MDTIKRFLLAAMTVLLCSSALLQPAHAKGLTENTVQVGDYVRFGTYSGQSITWRVIHKKADGSALLFSENILSVKPLDAYGDQVDYNNDGIMDTKEDGRADNGSNYWEKSNLREWLNSDSALVSYTHQVPDNNHVLGSFNNYYINEQYSESGFLTGFSQEEKTLIKVNTHKVLLSAADVSQKEGGAEPHAWSSGITDVVGNYNEAYYKNVTDQVFLLGIKELAEYVYGRGYEYRKVPTSAAIFSSEYKNPEYLNSEKNWSYWLGDPYAGNSYGQRIVHTSGDILASDAASGSIGVVPALYLVPNTVVTGGSGTMDQPYTVGKGSVPPPADEEESEPTGPQENEGKGIPVDNILDEKTGEAVVRVGDKALEDALRYAGETPEGTKVGVLEIPRVEGAKSYTLIIPTDMLVDGNREHQIQYRTEFGTVQIPGGMLRDMAAGPVSEIGVNIASIDPSSLSDDVKAKVGNRPIIGLSLVTDGRRVAYDSMKMPVKIEIPYEAKAEEHGNPEHIVIVDIDDQGNIHPVPNGKFDVNTGKVIFTTTHFGSFSVVYVNKSFQDVDDYEWAKKPIHVLAAKGVINGTGVETFSPGENITRADFVTLLVRALELKAEYTEGFADVEEGSYYSESVNIAKKLGIVKGTGDNKFDPTVTISRQDMMAMTAMALKASGKKLKEAATVDIAGYEDAVDIADYARDSVAVLVKNGIVLGNGKQIHPNGKSTRAEVAVMLYRIINK